MILEWRLKRTVRERIPIKKLVKIFYVNVKGEVEDLGDSKGALEEPKEGGFVKMSTGKNVPNFASSFTGGHRCKVRENHLYKVQLLHLYKVHSFFFRRNFW